MNPLEQDILKAVEDELTRAREKFGAVNNSHHESYAVILEEVTEAKELVPVFDTRLQAFWRHVMANGNPREMNECLRMAQEMATEIAAEWVQVAAMCRKAIITAIQQ